MTSCDIDQAKTEPPKLLDRVVEGETIVITRDGVPVAELVPPRKRGLILGSGIGDPNCNPSAPDDWWHPMTDEEVEAFYDGRY